MKGTIPRGQPTPRSDLDLRPGDLVRVKSYEEILATLDAGLSNRGLSFDAELVPFCGKVFRVSTSVERFVDEKTGKMRRMNTPAVILEGVICKALYSGQRMFCPAASICGGAKSGLSVPPSTRALEPRPGWCMRNGGRGRIECGRCRHRRTGAQNWLTDCGRAQGFNRYPL